MSSTVVYNGFQNLEGQVNQRGLEIVRLVSRRPVVWLVRHSCGSEWREPHVSVRYAGCRNNNCGQAPLEARRTMAQTGQAITATRSRDSESVRRFVREQTAQAARQRFEPGADAMKNADPDSMRRYLDYLEGR